MATLTFHRLRAGFYVTSDAQFRIVRRGFLRNNIRVWFVEQWNPNERQYIKIGSASTLKRAREGVRRAWLPVVEE